MYKIIGSDQKEYGPISAEQLRQWVAEGRINAQTLVQSDTDPSWRPLSSFPEFAASAAPSLAPFTPPMGGMDTRARALSLVSGPAIFMIVVAAIAMACDVLALIAKLAGMTLNQAQMPNMDPEAARMYQMMNGPATIFVVGFGLLVGAFVIFGAIKMKRLKSYGLSIAASIVVMLPCIYSCCCVIGLPAGIWALVVLNKPEVKSSFT